MRTEAMSDNNKKNSRITDSISITSKKIGP